VPKKRKTCDPTNRDDDHRGDYWDHVAYDPEHEPVLAVVPGARTEEDARAIVAEVAGRVSCDPPPLMTSDAYPAYATAIEGVFSVPVPAPPRRTPGRPRVVPERRLPEAVIDATVHKHREGGRAIAVEQRQVFGSPEAPGGSAASRRVDTSFVERQDGTDRGRNARKARKTYRFSKDWQVHEAMTYLALDSDNFCWCVRALRVRDGQGRWQERSPAPAAKRTDHVWTWTEWFNRPAVRST
jgi:IS1 family transposase